ncbi:MAG: SDR family NAD(P)-dependent oxidoreductase, partial [Hyphomonadaceae bacterium]
LSTLAEMKRAGAEIAAAEEKIDVLINNAGAMFDRRRETADGLEQTFAVNHMAYFVLTHLLLARVQAAAPSARIINTSSAMHRSGRLDFDDLQLLRGYSPWTAYSNSKLCNVLFTRALARRLTGSGMAVNAVHPGLVNSRFGDDSGPLLGPAFRAVKLGGLTPAQGAKTIVWLAAAPETATLTGGYYERCAPGEVSPAAQDDAAGDRLWAESARIAGLSA